MKNYTQAVINALRNDNPIIHIVEMRLKAGTVRLTSAPHDITYQNEEWISSGLMLDVGDFSESRDLRVESIKVKFTAVDQTVLALFTNNNQQNQKFIIKTLVLDDEHQVIGEVFSKSYTINAYSDEDSGNEASITVELSNFVSDFEAVRGIRSTLSSFARFYPNTTSFINSKDMKKELKWGEG